MKSCLSEANTQCVKLMCMAAASSFWRTGSSPCSIGETPRCSADTQAVRWVTKAEADRVRCTVSFLRPGDLHKTELGPILMSPVHCHVPCAYLGLQMPPEAESCYLQQDYSSD